MLRATTACTFSTSQLPKVVEWQVVGHWEALSTCHLWHLSPVTCGTCHLIPVTCHLLHDTCHLPPVAPVTCHLLHDTCHLLHDTCRLSPDTCHLTPVAPVTCHLIPVTCYMTSKDVDRRQVQHLGDGLRPPENQSKTQLS